MKAEKLQPVLSRAERLCRARGVRLTRQRRQILAIIAAAGRPLGAYDILAHLQQEDGRAAPPTVYRALDFLCEQRLVHKLETLHAYCCCEQPEHPHNSQFLICTHCGVVTELADDAVESSLDRAAAASGFTPLHEVVEVAGTCAHCVAKGGAA